MPRAVEAGTAQPDGIRPARERARKKVGEGMIARVNGRARAGMVQFSDYST